MKNSYLLMLAVPFFLVFFSNCKSLPDDKEKEYLNVTTSTIGKEIMAFPIHTCGRLSSKEEIRLSFKTGGIIKKIYVEEGENVKKGEKLAALNLEEIEAKVNAAKAALDKAKRDYRRADTLYRDSVATLEQYQNAKTALKVAKSDYEVAQFNLEHSIIKAPSSGTILKKMAEEEEITAAGYPVFLFGTTDNAWVVKTSVTDKSIVKISIGDTAQIRCDAYPEHVFNGYVSKSGSYADPYTGTYEVVLNVNDNDIKLVSGFIASVDIYPSVKDTFSVFSLKAITGLAKKTGYVYFLEGNKPVKQLIEFSEIRNEKVYSRKRFPRNTKYIVSGMDYIHSKNDSVVINNEK